jgi:hypothetical protein
LKCIPFINESWFCSGCDNCDEWHHWSCVGINEPPTDDESWFCKGCIAKQQQIESKFKKRRTKRDERASVESDRSHTKDDSESEPTAPTPKPKMTSSRDSKPAVEDGSEWICPACKRPDDGSPMIGCDHCDQWFHWLCVGIQVAPGDHEKWFCRRCKKHESFVKKKKHKK